MAMLIIPLIQQLMFNWDISHVYSSERAKMHAFKKNYVIHDSTTQTHKENTIFGVKYNITLCKSIMWFMLVNKKYFGNFLILFFGNSNKSLFLTLSLIIVVSTKNILYTQFFLLFFLTRYRFTKYVIHKIILDNILFLLNF